MTTTDLDTLIRDYLALWNEPDPVARRNLIEAVWLPDAVEILADPPEAVRKSAAELAFAAPVLTVRGHDALERRVRRAYEMFVEPGECVFAPDGPAQPLPAGTVAVPWAMVRRADGARQGGGLTVLAMSADGRIAADHMFVDGSR
ncbi:hypothetical protein ACWEQ0_21655 [Nocardia thailandica]|uniref:SnoaL-like domain-containing protein n=1 Tax=Nocardia thailandica TaxID=257275 RepID=A0ABW6PVW5_9NOCA